MATLALVLLGSVGFAAGGGVELIRNWFVTVEVKVNGEVVDVVDTEAIVETDGDGVATITLEEVELDADVDAPATAEVSIISADKEPQDGD